MQGHPTRKAKRCPFQRRCPHRLGGICDHEAPLWHTADDEHAIRCHTFHCRNRRAGRRPAAGCRLIRHGLAPAVPIRQIHLVEARVSKGISQFILRS